MCGIVGMLNPASAFHDKAFANLLVADTVRGPHSTGMYTVDYKDTCWYHKELGAGHEFIEGNTFKSMMSRLNKVVVGHNRWATRGAVSADNAHPFHHDGVTLVHNGTLTGEAGLPRKFGTDSEAICYALSQADRPEDVLSQLEGAFTLIWHDTGDNKLRMIRNSERPLYIVGAKHSDLVMFGSEWAMLKWAMIRNSIEPQDGYYTVPEASMLTFDLSKPPAERKVPAVREVKLQPKRTYASRWADNDYYRGGAAKSKAAKTPATSSASTISAPWNTDDQWIDAAKQDEVLKECGLSRNGVIIAGDVDWKRSDNSMFATTTLFGDGLLPRDDILVRVHNISRLPSSEADAAEYIIGDIISVRAVRNSPQYKYVLLVNPATVWVGDNGYNEVYRGPKCNVGTNNPRQVADTIHAAVGSTFQQFSKIDKGSAESEGAESKKKPAGGRSTDRDSASSDKDAGDNAGEREEGLVLGPAEIYVSKDEFRALTQGGCACCGNTIRAAEAELITWHQDEVMGPVPVCFHCYDDEEYMFDKLGGPLKKVKNV